MVEVRIELPCRRQAAYGHLNVRASMQHSGLQVDPTGHVRLRGLSAKKLRDLFPPSPSLSFFHHRGARVAMIVRFNCPDTRVRHIKLQVFDCAETLSRNCHYSALEAGSGRFTAWKSSFCSGVMVERPLAAWR